jgi:hypothetical protein
LTSLARFSRLDRREKSQFLVACVVLAAVVCSLAAGAAARPSSSRSALHAGRHGILYRENWENGRLDTTQWGAQCNNLTEPNFATRGSYTVQQTTVGQGRWAARFDLPADATKPTACEVIHDRTLDLGRDDYYALALRFPKNWREPSGVFWGLVIAQFNYEGITGPPVGLAAHGNYVNLIVGSGFFDGVATRWYTGNGIGRGNLPRLFAIPRPLKREVWHQLVIHVRWSAGMDGEVDVKHRIRGQNRWKQTVRLRGVPTVQWSRTRPALSALGTTDKIGAYRAQSSFPISLVNDGFCRAGSFRAAERCLR